MLTPTKYRIDLSSDTKTKPSAGMRQAMAEAEVGDEQIGEDPTVNRLIEMVCDKLGKEDGLYLPTGTMCNQIAQWVHTQGTAGGEVIADKTAHVRNYETGGAAALAGCLIWPIDGVRGVFNPEQFKAAIRYESNYDPRSTLVVMEQTSNRGGGTVWPLENIKSISEIAQDHGIKRHMDGARLFNAVVKSGIAAKDYTQHVDSVWIDFSKGLGAPMGAVLTGTKEFIRKARRMKHMLGGAMRQAGVVAATNIYALENNIKRLKDDHDNAQILAEGLDKIEGIEVRPYETNIVFFDVAGLGITADEFTASLKSHSLRFSETDHTLMRAVTHLDVSKNQIHDALDIVNSVHGS